MEMYRKNSDGLQIVHKKCIEKAYRSSSSRADVLSVLVTACDAWLNVTEQ